MKQYHDFLRHILNYGVIKGDRTGTGTISAIVPPSMRFDLQQGFPIVTTKEVNFEKIKRELKWFTRGDTNIRYLLKHNVNIWNSDAYRWFRERSSIKLSKKEFIEKIKTDDKFASHFGDLGPIYGKQWRSWDGIDQLQLLIENIREIKEENFSPARRLIVSAWNVYEIEDMALPPCHVLMQFFVEGHKLSCHLYQRSGDAFLGIPYNIASYSLLTHIIALQTGLEVGEFIHTVGDAHIYLNHTAQVKEQLSRRHKNLPDLMWDKKEFTIDNWEPEDFSLFGYFPHPAIKGDLSV